MSSMKPMFVGFLTFSGTILAMATYKAIDITTGLNVS
jgi:hypothetical protein